MISKYKNPFKEWRVLKQLERYSAEFIYLIGGPHVSLMVWVVTPSPLRFKGTSSGLTLTATL